MTYQPQFTVSVRLLALIEEIVTLREKILAATVHVPWIPALQKDARVRNTHSSTAIEGNPLTLEQVRLLEEGRRLPTESLRSTREVLNYFAGLRHIEKHQNKKSITHEDVLKLHAIIASSVMDQGTAGRYRTIRVRVGNYLPPAPEMVSGLMAELLGWWNMTGGVGRLHASWKKFPRWSPVITSAIVHYRFEEIHPFADGNGRTGRMLALWELYRKDFDTHHIFSVDEIYWKNRPGYYEALASVRKQGGDLTEWLEYTAEALYHTLGKVWLRVQRISAGAGNKKIVLRPKQEQLLQMLRDRKSMTPLEIREGIGVSKQGAMDLLNPLLHAGIVRRIGTKKSGKYILA
ncbi:MAG: Fic family protein [Nitrospirae bacterium]|nr:Fic family protein [Nitrospirota bacterium]